MWSAEDAQLAGGVKFGLLERLMAGADGIGRGSLFNTWASGTDAKSAVADGGEQGGENSRITVAPRVLLVAALLKHVMSGDSTAGLEAGKAMLKQLWAADLRKANLSGAHLEKANLTNAHLEGANLQGARLKGANLWSAHLGGADLSNADVKNADLRNANLVGANLTGVVLASADIRGATIGAGEPSLSVERADLDRVSTALRSDLNCVIAELRSLSLANKPTDGDGKDEQPKPAGAPPAADVAATKPADARRTTMEKVTLTNARSLPLPTGCSMNQCTDTGTGLDLH